RSYCRLWSRWRTAETFLQKHGEIYPLKVDRCKVKCFQAYPQVATANKLAQQLTRLEQEFGMTPSARVRIRGAAVTCARRTRRIPSPRAVRQEPVLQAGVIDRSLAVVGEGGERGYLLTTAASCINYGFAFSLP